MSNKTISDKNFICILITLSLNIMFWLFLAKKLCKVRLIINDFTKISIMLKLAWYLIRILIYYDKFTLKNLNVFFAILFF